MSDFLPPFCLLPLIIYTCERLTLGEATWCLEAIHPVRVRVYMISAMKMVLRDELLCIPVI